MTACLWRMALPAMSLEVPLPARPVTVDGNLNEWGNAAWITVRPAGDGVGLRGVFASDDDHDAVVLVQWDARFLYLAAAVQDDTLDGGRVAPARREWRGPAGERKDRMFYFDHFKVFVREPGAHAGYNLWFAPPLADDDRPYWWGGRQRQAPRERPAIEVAAQVRDRTRTFEVALPWAWLEAYPQPGDRFDALFLFVDSDAPGSEVATKIGRAHDRWIWWEGDLQLTGTPDGLRPRPVPEEKVTTAPPVAPAPLDARVAGAIARSRQADSAAVAEAVAAARADSEAAAESRPAAAAAEPSSAATSTEPTTSASVATTDVPSSTGSLRARLNRQRLARRAASRAPEWMRPFATGSTTATQVDSYYTVLQRQLRRIVVDDVSTRIDVYVVDMAAAAASDRGLARRYLVALLRWLHEAPDETVSAHYRHVEGQLGIDAQRVADFVRAVSGRSAELFEGHETTTTRELLRRGAREAGLSETEAVRVLGALAGIEGG